MLVVFCFFDFVCLFLLSVLWVWDRPIHHGEEGIQTRIETDTRIMGFCCDRRSYVVRGRIVQRFLEVWVEKADHWVIKALLTRSVRAWKRMLRTVQIRRVSLFQRQVREFFRNFNGTVYAILQKLFYYIKSTHLFVFVHMGSTAGGQHTAAGSFTMQVLGIKFRSLDLARVTLNH